MPCGRRQGAGHALLGGAQPGSGACPPRGQGAGHATLRPSTRGGPCTPPAGTGAAPGHWLSPGAIFLQGALNVSGMFSAVTVGVVPWHQASKVHGCFCQGGPCWGAPGTHGWPPGDPAQSGFRLWGVDGLGERETASPVRRVPGAVGSPRRPQQLCSGLGVRAPVSARRGCRCPLGALPPAPPGAAVRRGSFGGRSYGPSRCGSRCNMAGPPAWHPGTGPGSRVPAISDGHCGDNFPGIQPSPVLSQISNVKPTY